MRLPGVEPGASCDAKWLLPTLSADAEWQSPADSCERAWSNATFLVTINAPFLERGVCWFIEVVGVTAPATSSFPAFT